jgi:hypothetical protein
MQPPSRINRIAAWYGFVVGLLMIAQWAASILSGSVPEFESAPWAIGFHLAAEMTTAFGLIIGGVATLRSAAWGKSTLLVALGMVTYSEIVSPGYFAQLGQWPFVGMFAILLFGAAWSVMLLLKETVPFRATVSPESRID